MDLNQRLAQQQLLKVQKEELLKNYQDIQVDRVIWEENQKEKDQLVQDLREALHRRRKNRQPRRWPEWNVKLV